jgi:putative MFS transporter
MAELAQTTEERIAGRIERISFGTFHLKPASLLGIAMLFDAYDVYVVSVAAVTVTAFKLTDSMIGFIVSASYFGQLLGSLTLGYASERIGRKWAVIWSLASFGLLSNFTAFAMRVEMLVVARDLQGLGIGALPPIAGAMFSELLPFDRRGKYGMLFQVLYPVGIALLLGLPLGPAAISFVKQGGLQWGDTMHERKLIMLVWARLADGGETRRFANCNI